MSQALKPDIYAVYRNSDGISYLHKGCHLKQCGDYTNNFYSVDMAALTFDKDSSALVPAYMFGADRERQSDRTDSSLVSMPIFAMEPLRDCVLMINPFPGIRYSRFELSDVSAVLHGLYHARTACVNVTDRSQSYGEESVLSLVDRCQENGVSFYIHPCSASDYTYSSTSFLFDHGSLGLYGMTREAAYAKLLISYALYKKNQEKERNQWLHTEVCGEMIYRNTEENYYDL